MCGVVIPSDSRLEKIYNWERPSNSGELSFVLEAGSSQSKLIEFRSVQHASSFVVFILVPALRIRGI